MAGLLIAIEGLDAAGKNSQSKMLVERLQHEGREVVLYSFHRYDTVLGSHSVHTSTGALREAEARISAIETRLIQQGRL